MKQIQSELEIKRNSKDKMKRMKKIEADKGELCNEDLHDNIETSLKASVYMYYRTLGILMIAVAILVLSVSFLLLKEQKKK